jgi:NAD(P)-dependent dehydrogenase (short-subunit alcohol dehydrogenase family)
MRGAFDGQVVLITGASSGIGAELARQFAAAGARVALAARDAEALARVAEECRTHGGDALVVPTDVTIEAQCQAMVDRTVVHFGRLDILVNNAGMSMSARFDEISDLSVFERLLRLNVLGSVWSTAFALPHLKQSRGRIVAIASLAGLTGVPKRTAYCASKHAMAGFFDALRIELRDSGVSVTVVYPGFVRSDINRRALAADGAPFGDRASLRQPREAMDTAECARQVLRATAARDRDLIMTLTGKLGRILKWLTPSLVDRLAFNATAARQ